MLAEAHQVLLRNNVDLFWSGTVAMVTQHLCSIDNDFLELWHMLNSSQLRVD